MCLQGCLHACYALMLHITCNEIIGSIFIAAKRLAEGGGYASCCLVDLEMPFQGIFVRSTAHTWHKDGR